jgi:prolipoprotein diacylglyceryltransferase
MKTLIAVIIIVGIPFWLWMLTDAIMTQHKKRHHSNLWVFFIAITFIIGALVYYFTKKRK